MILLIDNYDSFTYNLVQRLGELGKGWEVRVERNDRITPRQAEGLRPTHLIISPGPCTPGEAGVSVEMIRHFAGRVPILGVCLGHQCIGAMHGMTVARHAVPVHGKTSPVHHDAAGIFAGMPQPFEATRYHSLVVTPESVPTEGWAVSAWTDERAADGSARRVVMGLRRVWPADAPAGAAMDGVQFHPESFLTSEGSRLLGNFLAQG